MDYLTGIREAVGSLLSSTDDVSSAIEVSSTVNIHNLHSQPNEILSSIFQYLKLRDVHSVLLTCKKFRDVASFLLPKVIVLRDVKVHTEMNLDHHDLLKLYPSGQISFSGIKLYHPNPLEQSFGFGFNKQHSQILKRFFHLIENEPSPKLISLAYYDNTLMVAYNPPGFRRLRIFLKAKCRDTKRNEKILDDYSFMRFGNLSKVNELEEEGYVKMTRVRGNTWERMVYSKYGRPLHSSLIEVEKFE